MINAFSIIFLAVSAVHLVFCVIDNDKLRALTKPLLMPALALAVAITLCARLPDSRTALVLIVFALFFGFLGDVFLINKSPKLFFTGACCFLVGHIFWIAQYASSFKSFPIWAYIVAAACYAAAIALAYGSFNKPKGPFGIGFIIYALFLSALNSTGIAAVHAHKTTGAVLFLAGSILFIISDTILARTVFKSKFFQSHFLIMVTYIAAQVLLACGVVLPYFNN